MMTIQPILSIADLTLLSPEIFVLLMSCATLIIGLFIERYTYVLAQLTLLGAAVFTLWNFHASAFLFDGMYLQDQLASLLKLFMYAVTGFVFLYARALPPTITTRTTKSYEGEYYCLGLFSLLGMMVLVSSTHFMSFFLGLEILSLPLYAMVALERGSATATEASMKYFVTGSVASALLLYGFSLIYGVTHALSFLEIAEGLSFVPSFTNLALIVGLIFAFAGVLFKLGATPFHMWVPDVYEGATTKVTLFVACAPKIAALGIIVRFVAQALPNLHIEMQSILIIASITSMLLGNLVAIVQSNLKRMLAYSSIAHVGYMLLGVIAANSTGYAAAVFYALVYAITAAGAFGLLVLMSHTGFAVENIRDLQGLNGRNPWLAFMMLITMFSMAGIPPFVGFFAKLGVLEALVMAHFVWLAVVALLFAIIGSYYYIAVIKVMYFEEPADEVAIPLALNAKAAISINGLSILLLGLFPSGLIAICRQAMGL